MVKFFFHIDECGRETRDDKGRTLVDTASALQTAIRLSWEVMSSEVAQGRLCLSCSIVVENDANGDQMIVPFRDTLRLSGL